MLPGGNVRGRAYRPHWNFFEEHLHQDTMHCFTKVAQEEGMATGLYKGFVANIVRNVGGALVLVFCDRANTALNL